MAGLSAPLLHLCGLRVAEAHSGWSVPMPFWLRNSLNLTSAVDCSDCILSLPLPHPVCSRNWMGKRGWRGTFLAYLPVPEARSLSLPPPQLCSFSGSPGLDRVKSRLLPQVDLGLSLSSSTSLHLPSFRLRDEVAGIPTNTVFHPFSTSRVPLPAPLSVLATCC